MTKHKHLVFRDPVRMLNGSGPIAPPMRTLYVDGSPESERAYHLLADRGIAFAVEGSSPGSGVTLHDGFLHVDHVGYDEIAEAVDGALRVYAVARAGIGAVTRGTLPPDDSTERLAVRASVEAEQEARDATMQRAIAAFAMIPAAQSDLKPSGRPVAAPRAQRARRPR